MPVSENNCKFCVLQVFTRVFANAMCHPMEAKYYYVCSFLCALVPKEHPEGRTLGKQKCS